MMEVKLKVHGVVSDPKTETQIVILRDEQNLEVLPIWVGFAEGNAIRFAVEGILPQRPLTHDLLKSLLDHMGAKVQKVVVTGIKNNTYFATVHLETKVSTATVDARPSDAIALALRANVPIYVEDEVLKKRSVESLDAWLERLNPKELGRFDA
jgi:bifunctional DNase/RNase